MEDKKMLTDEEMKKVTGGFEYEGQEYDSVQLLDKWIDALNSGDYIELDKLYYVSILPNLSQFLADIEKAGRTIPDGLLKEFPLF